MKAARPGPIPPGMAPSYTVEFDPVELQGRTYFVPGYARHRPAARAIVAGRLYEPQTHTLVARLLAEEPGSLVHAGTFFGDMLPSFSAACAGTVYAFEPVLENYLLARLCVEENQLRNVVLFHAGLGAQVGGGFVETHVRDVHRGGASRLADHGQPTTVMTIDALGLRDLRVLQLDVEGHERFALSGARATIGRCRPTILVEDNGHTCGPFFDALGYARIGAVPGLRVWAPTEAARPLLARLGDAGIHLAA